MRQKPVAPADGEMTLDVLPVGVEGCVVRVAGDKAIRLRLMEMGLVRGERVRVQRTAPFGDPIALRVKGYELAVRRCEARGVVVRVGNGSASQGLQE